MLSVRNKNKIIAGLVVLIVALGLFLNKTTIEQKDITIKKLEESLKKSETAREELAIKLKEVSEEKDIVIREKINADGSSVTTKKISSKKNSKDLSISNKNETISNIEQSKKEESLVDKSVKITNPSFLDIGLGVSNRSDFYGKLFNPDWHIKIKATKGKEDLQLKINDRGFILEYNFYFLGF